MTTKLHNPPARSQLLVRPRLLAQLDAGLSGKLTLLSAPAGFGKTTLVSAWRATAAGSAVPFAWVSLDAADSDPLRFWSYVIAALDMLQPDSAATALALLQSPQPPPIEAVLTPLLNALSTLMSDVVLVLDDYHLIDATAIHTALTFLLDHLPARLHLIITTRADPPLPLTRLRARGQLTELRAADLRFTAEETAAFLTELIGLPLSAEDVAALDARTEGWIAGLQLAVLAMRDRSDISGFITAFTGSHRFVVDYLAEEVFTSQPQYIQTFLLQTAVLDRMCGPLCDAVLGIATTDDRRPTTDGSTTTVVGDQWSVVDSYSQLILDQLERANLFLVPLDDARQWYRYHHLFAEVLRARLQNGATASELANLHQRASAWYEEQGLSTEAIEHALEARDVERAARLIEQIQWTVFGHSTASHTLATWLTALPEALVQARPRLCLAQALLAKQSNFAVLEGWVRQAEAALERTTPAAADPTIRGELAAFQATLAMYSGNLEEAIKLAQQALGTIAPYNSLLRSTAMMIESQALLANGNLVGAEAAFGRIASAATASNISSAISAACNRAYLQRAQGRLQAASATCRSMVDRAIRLGVDTIPELGFVTAVQADIARERNDLHTAQKYATDALALNPSWADPNLRQLILLVQARVQQAHGDLAAALLTLDAARQIEHVASALFSGILAAFSAQLTLMRGDLTLVNAFDDGSADAATAVAQVSPLFMVYVAEHNRIAPIQALIAAARAGSGSSLLHQALELIEQEQAPAESAGLGWLQTKLYVLRALAAHALGEIGQAIAALNQALSLAAPEGVMRVFLDEGAPMAALLREAHARGIAPSYIEKLLAAFPRTEATGLKAAALGASRSVLGHQSLPLVEPLSTRELEILRLIAEGHSNQAIADTLIIAISTVKRHINNIYGKLAVQSRTQALARARELKLL